ncbi:penicillin-binding transpeptidase domain-containing protein [Acidimicrobiaceae bacterium]|nr:penicillin-binding transpeptidase domain-containing protein [Acidimicrobiaceae bacterium]
MFNKYRLNFVFLLFSLLLVVILSELFSLQVINNEENALQIENQNFEVFYIPAPRGEIFDINGNKLAVSDLEPYLYLNLRKINDDNRNTYIQLLQFNFKDITNSEIDKFFNTNDIFIKIINLSEYDPDIRLRLLDYEAFEVFNLPTRIYPYNELFSHVIGYVGNPNKDEQINFPNSLNNGLVGKTGLERYYENTISGVASEVVIKNGNIIEIKPSVSGRDIQLVLDTTTQNIVKESLQEGINLANKNFDTINFIERGAVVVQKIDTGEIVSMVSLPDFDPNQFVLGISEFDFKQLNRTQAFNNFAIQGLYPPGSVFKVVAYWLALNEGIFPETAINAQDYIECEGSLSFGFDDGSKQVYQDWKDDGHGKVNLSQAIKQSCNVYFWDIALKIWRTFGNTDSEALLQEYSRQLGFSSLSNIDLPFEKKGVVPDRKLFEEWTISRPELVRPEGWLGGDLMNLIIGQGAITTTPVQVSNAYRTLLTGEKSAPFLSLESSDNSIEKINISDEFVEFLLDDLNLVTNPGGTAYKSFQVMGDQIFDIGGKTGTAQNAGELNNTSWFVGVDSISNPMYIVVTVVEEGGSGSAVAAPISRRIIQHLRESDLTPVEFGEITE